mmetsp:Transcript_147673/g.260370  ORF Transcript_147673/g.260370 Transcript_147673/m.260370 type:complete len:407 (+) Transcript_147673:120-1340(+)
MFVATGLQAKLVPLVWFGVFYTLDSLVVNHLERPEKGLEPRGLSRNEDLHETRARELHDLDAPFYRVPDQASMQDDVGQDLRLSNEISTDIANSPAGVVCPTLLHEDIRDQNFIPTLTQTEGLEPGPLVKEVRRLCGGSGGAAVKEYTGSWVQMQPTQNDIRILKGIFAWVEKHRTSNKPFEISHEHGPFIRKVAGEKFARRVRRVLDFGCGGGNDLASVKKEFGITKKEDLLCLDIFHSVGEGVTPIALDSTSDEAYNASLNKALLGRRGSVDIVFSLVTFHHVNQGPNMRANAFRFISKVLAPGGIFIMSDWDNTGTPDRTIWFDLAHYLPSILHHEFCPTDPSRLNQQCAYFGFDDWNSLVQQASSSMLEWDKTRFKMRPLQMAKHPGNSNRDFVAVWKKSDL